MKPKVYIMAGGSGTRLQPLSQTEKGRLPKQFLKIVGSTTLLQETLERIPSEYEIGVIPEKKYSEEVYRQAHEVGRVVTVLEEPFGCNTAAAILYAGLFEQMGLHEADRVLCFLPADHRMEADVFQPLLERAVELAEESDRVVTIGIQPNRAETNYGYIKTGKPYKGSLSCYSVERFVEKPSKDTAELYLHEGGYYWNGGIFIMKTSVLIEAARQYCPNILNPIAESLSLDRLESITDAYKKIRAAKWNISIDYALMEHIATKLLLLPAPVELGWNDLGNWESLHPYMQADESGNAYFPKSHIDFTNSKNLMVCNYTDLPVQVEGCEDLLLVVTENGILVRRKGSV